MAYIIAGRFGQQTQVEQAIEALCAVGIASTSIASFYLNPAGRHDLYPYGGDREDSPGAKDTGSGIAIGTSTGGIVGAAVGLAAGPVGPVFGALLGAHVGNLIGSLAVMKETGEPEAGNENAVPQRQPGMVVATSIAALPQAVQVVKILRELGADQLESADGTIADGDWVDFNPLTLPCLLPPDGTMPAIDPIIAL